VQIPRKIGHHRQNGRLRQAKDEAWGASRWRRRNGFWPLLTDEILDFVKTGK
jgi:hypothetical protein